VLGVNEIVQLLEAALAMTGESSMAKTHHAANTVIVKVLI
jgi:hypothetical protein